MACLLQVSVNDKFASLSEALYIAERQAREEIRLRNEVKKQKKIREEELREQQLRQLAAQARAERSDMLFSSPVRLCAHIYDIYIYMCMLIYGM